MSGAAHLLVVDDDDRLRALLSRYLREQDFFVSTAQNAAEARELLQWFAFDLMVLDVMMPGETGLEFLRTARRETLPPVLILSALGEGEDRVSGLESGADDYLPKPFEPRELGLRIRAILRRARAARPSSLVALGDYVFNFSSGELSRGRNAVVLTESERHMLSMLAKNLGHPLSREALAENSDGRAVDVQIARLRKKLGEGFPLQTVRGEGYLLRGERKAKP